MLDMRVPLYLTVLLAFFAMPVSSLAGTSEYSMTLGVGEEYNSNVNEKSNAQADWVSKATAVGKVKYQSARIEADGEVDGSFNVYALGNRNDEFKGSALVNAKVTLAEELLFVEAHGTFKQVYNNLIRGETNPTDSTRSQVDQYVTSGRVYMTPRLSDRLSSMIGYEFIGYFYGDGANTDSNINSTSYGSAKNKISNGVFANFVYELTPLWQITLDANTLRQDSRTGGLQRTYVNAGFRWQYSEDGYISAKVGPRYSAYDNGNTSLNPYVDAVWSHTLNRFTAKAILSSLYTENPVATYSTLKKTAGLSLAWQGEKLNLQANASLSNTDGEDTRDSDQLALGVVARYEITPRLMLKAGASRNSTVTSSYTQVRWYANGGLEYSLGKDFSLEGYYRWKIYDSSQGSSLNYNVNIVGLSLKKTF